MANLTSDINERERSEPIVSHAVVRLDTDRFHETVPQAAYGMASSPAEPSFAYRFCKRLIDLTASSLILLAGLPLFVVIAAMIKLTSRGPIFFVQPRLARNGGTFPCFKFRTMVVNAEEILRREASLRAQFADGYKLKNDPRITRIGAILRKTSLDETPQFLNVFLGQMSLIGPRPIVPPEISMYGEHGARLLMVKPGLGGLWQVSGRSDTTYEERIALDMEYVTRRSLALDIWLLWKTAVMVLMRKGAY